MNEPFVDEAWLLEHLRECVILTDSRGRVTYINHHCHVFIRQATSDLSGKHWKQICRFRPRDRLQLEAMLDRPSSERMPITVEVVSYDNRCYRLSISVYDDPHDSGRKMICIDDVEAGFEKGHESGGGNGHPILVTHSKVMQMVFQQISDVARVDATVLIEGETGTGKELVAHAIHDSGERAGKPFIPVNCAGLTESLVASQLFGHKRGAFTGAVADQKGSFEAADGGTIFLDEIGDIPLAMQTSLLRVLQEKEIIRVGESTPRKIDVRVIAATNQDLDALVASGAFRKDLLYRIRVSRIQVPPLRARKEDIPVLCQAFIDRLSAEHPSQAEHISDEAMRILTAYDWPGNIRELLSAIESAGIACKNKQIRPQDLPSELIQSQNNRQGSNGSRETEKIRIVDALRNAGGNRSAAARLLGISRATLYRRLGDLNLMAAR